ncbi:hypothetical protein IWQ47_001275 [Aquimarina sp. EL_43]|nr:hypothetical protein [Aquimarina sp. EL_35]MBG6150487.1 hypothetical protein [Aquimarina sp. EL_32]MBG6168205.1 hypothetical protein [Aquimarina sp. EL_43]
MKGTLRLWFINGLVFSAYDKITECKNDIHYLVFRAWDFDSVFPKPSLRAHSSK